MFVTMVTTEMVDKIITLHMSQELKQCDISYNCALLYGLFPMTDNALETDIPSSILCHKHKNHILPQNSHHSIFGLQV